MEKTTAIVMFNQKTKLDFDGLNVKLKKTAGKMKSKGMNPKDPINALMSPKNGSIAAIVVEIMTDNDLETTRGRTLRAENSSLLGSANIRSSTSFVGCK